MVGTGRAFCTQHLAAGEEHEQDSPWKTLHLAWFLGRFQMPPPPMAALKGTQQAQVSLWRPAATDQHPDSTSELLLGAAFHKRPAEGPGTIKGLGVCVE